MISLNKNLIYIGMVERCHWTLESVLKKVMQKQDDWTTILDSVLLEMRSQVHSSTGYSPMWLLYSKDPVMPFEMADKLKYSQETLCNNVLQNDNQCEVTDSQNYDLKQMVEKLGKHWEEIFQNAKTK